MKFFLNEPSEDYISEYTWEDVLNGVNDAVVYKHLKTCDPVMQKIIVMLKNKYCVYLHNAVECHQGGMHYDNL